MWRKILYISLWVILIAGLITTMGFIEQKKKVLACSNFDINVKKDTENYFVENDDVKLMLKAHTGNIMGQTMNELNFPQIEKILNSNSAIENAEVSVSVSGDVQVDVVQRKPIVRLFNTSNESFYIDKTGTLMPLSEKFTAKVLIANGNINESYSLWYKKTISEIEGDTLYQHKTLLDDIFKISTFIVNDEFWNAQVQQIFINDDKEFELVPRVGDHKIIFGDLLEMEEKFKKLKTFYLKGLNATGQWTSYSIVNLKYKDQIVCTKK